MPAPYSPPPPVVPRTDREQPGHPHRKAPVAAPTPAETPGQRTLHTGGYLMGFGAASVGVGLLFAGISAATHVEAFTVPALVLGVTVGPILLVIGLLVVIVGAIIRATED
jgi:hypothetical protein